MASALVALADWNPAPATPPNNNVPAPINVGPNAVAQVKSDGLTIQGLLGLGSMQFQPGGAAVAIGSVMVAKDQFGTVMWSDLIGASGTGSCQLRTAVVTSLQKDTAKVITFSRAFPSGTVPVIVVTPTVSTAQTYITNISNTGFSATPQANTSIGYIAISGSDCTFHTF